MSSNKTWFYVKGITAVGDTWALYAPSNSYLEVLDKFISEFNSLLFKSITVFIEYIE